MQHVTSVPRVALSFLNLAFSIFLLVLLAKLIEDYPVSNVQYAGPAQTFLPSRTKPGIPVTT